VRYFTPGLRLLAGCLLLPLPAVLLRADDPPRPSPATIQAAQMFRAIERDWDGARKKYETALGQAKSKSERDEAARLQPDPGTYADRCLRLFADRPDTWGGAAALYWVVCNAGGTEQARTALGRLKDGPMAKADLRLVNSLFFSADPRQPPARKLAPLVYDRAVREPDHPEAGNLLIWVCRVAVADPAPEAAKLCRQAGDRVVARYPDTLYLWRFCREVLDGHADPAWAEGHLRTILAGKDSAAQVAASSALAALLQNKDEASQSEAERLYRRVIKEAARAGEEWNRAAHRLPESVLLFPESQAWVSRAEAELAEMKARGLGKPAPDLVGDDLDGKSMRLSEYRGKVVLLSFWASWCGPCLALVPQERELVRRLADRPFAVVGVNGDRDLAPAVKAATDKGITWRSIRDRRGPGAVISEEWAVTSWPTLYLIDHTGVIRKRWVGAPPAEVLLREVERVVVAAERGKR
jgi:thiol-disulfide isomerase/thioredoxin